ncbi:MAG: aspartate aminotransferase family protein [Anaerolineae bacterium]
MTTPVTYAQEIIERYIDATPLSRELYERAVRALPGGNTRTTVFIQPYPFYFRRGQGSRVWDVDGNERLDFINNYTSLILGHAHPRVVAAVQERLTEGMSVAAPTELEVALAERLKERLPSMDLLRFTNSGTEATALAIRAARAFTGREKLAKFEGSYHGSHDYAAVDVAAGGAVGAGTVTKNAGIPQAVADTIVMLPFNDAERAVAIIEAHKDDLAAVIIEPVLGSGGVIPAHPDFLRALREVTAQHGIVFIFDEIIAFRVGYHGAQGHYGVTPDLTTLGKIIGGGLPVGAVGGREDIMRRFDPRRADHIGHGGTFNANPLTMAAGLATLDEMTPAQYDRLEGMTRRLAGQLCDLFAGLGVPAQVTHIGSVFNIHLTDRPVTDYASASAGDRQSLAQLYLAALNHGVAFTGRGMGCLSTPMTDADLDTFVAAMRAGMADLGAA